MTDTVRPREEVGSDYWQYTTLDQQSTGRAYELFVRADGYRDAKREDYAHGCERKALRWLEHSYWLRTSDKRTPPYPWITSAYSRGKT